MENIQTPGISENTPRIRRSQQKSEYQSLKKVIIMLARNEQGKFCQIQREYGILRLFLMYNSCVRIGGYMGYIAAAILILGISGAFGYSRLKGMIPKTPVSNHIIGSLDIDALSMDEVADLLDRLNNEDPPDPIRGAMCYSPAAQVMVAEFICPVCGEKTIYSSGEADFIERELPGCRRLAESINDLTQFNISLDESLFCEFCSDSVIESPVMLLRVSISDGTEVISRVSEHDLMILDSFFKGNLYYTTWNAGRQPLQDYAGRIGELLGIE